MEEHLYSIYKIQPKNFISKVLPDVFAAKILSSSSFIINGSNKHDVTRIALTISCNSLILVI